MKKYVVNSIKHNCNNAMHVSLCSLIFSLHYFTLVVWRVYVAAWIAIVVMCYFGFGHYDSAIVAMVVCNGL